MINSQTSKKQGFTIIEIVLVLAVAGLIFLMIFMAIPALQRAQRDNGRKRSVGLVAAAINSWKANNKGRSLINSIEGYEKEYEGDATDFLNEHSKGWLKAVDGGILDEYLSLDSNNNSSNSNILPKEISGVKIILATKLKNIRFVLNRDVRGEDKHSIIYIMAGVRCPEDSTSMNTGRYKYTIYPKSVATNASVTAFM